MALAINVEGTRHVLELAAELPTRPRVLFVSTAKVYAPVDCEHPRVSEEAPIGPSMSYGMTKLAAEELVLAADEEAVAAEHVEDALALRPIEARIGLEEERCVHA